MGGKVKYLTHLGKTMRIYQWAEELGVTASAISQRLSDKWTVERALTVPFKGYEMVNTNKADHEKVFLDTEHGSYGEIL